MAQITHTFSGRDFTAEFERLLALLRDELPEYTDWNHSDAGIVLLRLLARETDQLNYYIDRVFAEGFLSTAQFRQSLVDLGLLVGYLPTLAAAASTRLRLVRRPDAGNGAITIPKYSEFTRIDGLPYLTVEAVTIAEGESQVEVDASQGNLVTLSINPGEFGVMDWTRRPKRNLGRSIAAGSCEVWHGNPALAWSEVDGFWRSWPEDRHFLLELNGDDDSVWLVMGDGTQGMLPPAHEPLQVRFVRTAEALGNCGHSRISGVPDGLADLITCTNIEPATGGAPAEGTESLRRMIPRVTRTQRRGVTTEDYEALIEHMPGVLHVQAIDRNDVAGPLAAAMFGSAEYGWPHLYVVLVVVPEGGGPMSSLLKEQIWAQCGNWGHLGNWRSRYVLTDAIAVPVNVAMRVGVLPGNQPDVVTSAVISSVQNVMAIENQTIGGTLRFAVLHQAASAVAGVSWVEFDAPISDTVAPAGHVITAGMITAQVQ